METIKYDAETGEKLVRDIRNITLTYQGHSKTFPMPGWYPADIDEGTFTDEDMKVYDRALNQVKAEAENLLLPNDIRSIRKKLKLTQVQAGTILGGGKKAFQKYESGEILPSRAISNLLKLLSLQPNLLKSL
ncbi:type II toxin-antitoxin system MqsA family antitoxin [Selenomonas ruminantium]|uniref:HTH-type transcriptional regulator / antitoxin MqsA n=1 Tax=Selenomonas ruminantium TaxID=971 RepID=A0A1H0S385_SELRU|nr:type II toxin-antitoxin system MqsA family antitoxin [Selenomonas ruminantium]SDP36134.1 HTH-type transcriptional regulator / antitoxin MqsA [Selenomonas ruminantium]